MKNRIIRLKKNPFAKILIYSFLFLILTIGWPLSSVCDFFISNAAAGVIIDPGPDQSVCKELPLAGYAAMNQDSTPPFNNAIKHMWFGPFETSDLPNPSVIIPEGRYTVSHIINTGSSLSDVTTSLIEVKPCFTIASRDKRGKVQLTWSPMAGITRYDVYRAHESNPQQFEKIAETVSDYATYLDYGVQNESSYLYLVGALVNGNWSYSNVVSAHPTAIRSRTRPNYAPLIHSFPVTNGTVGILYNYDVNAIDPNNDALSYFLISSPGGMTITPDTGVISWTPGTEGTYPVQVLAEDGKGGAHTQNFTITIEKIAVPVQVSLNADPVSINQEGGSVTLSWSSAFAETVTIDNGVGPVELNGTMTLFLKEAAT
ncbi:MAG: Ig domain-containing protein, partial [Desulfobacula sp.]|nr:Ig domain-containing protein [Desulfobacula sp.]